MCRIAVVRWSVFSDGETTAPVKVSDYIQLNKETELLIRNKQDRGFGVYLNPGDGFSCSEGGGESSSCKHLERESNDEHSLYTLSINSHTWILPSLPAALDH